MGVVQTRPVNLTTLILLSLTVFYAHKAVRQPVSAWEGAMRRVAGRPAPQPIAALPAAKPRRTRRPRAKAA